MEFRDRKKYIENNPFFGKENCPFCKKDEFYVDETEYWQISYNKNPYYGYKQNFIVYPKTHKSFLYELSEQELGDIKNVEKWMQNIFKDKPFYSLLRNSMKGRSVEHLHYHYCEGTIEYDSHNENGNYYIIKNISEGKT